MEEDAADLGILAALKNEGLIKDAEGILEAAAEEPGQTEETAETDSIPDSEYESEVREEAAAQEGEEPLDMVISLPMGNHTGNTLRNLVNMIYSRGPLLSKASGGALPCGEGTGRDSER